MTTLTKVAHTITDTLVSIKNRVCDDGQFCENVALSFLSITTVWMMFVAMQPII